MNTRSIFRMMTVLVISGLMLVSCSQDELPVLEEEAIAFSSNGNDPGIADISVGGDETFYKFYLNNGKSVWSNKGKYWLGVVADEKVRAVYIFAPGKHSEWKRVDPQFGDFGKGSFDVDAFLRNDGDCRLFNPDKSGLKAFAVGPLVYVVFGNKYATLRVDSGEVFRESGLCGSLPNDITCIDYLRFKNTFDFRGAGFFVGVTEDGFVAGSSDIEGPYEVPQGKSSSDVNSVNKKNTFSNVSCLEVVSNKAVVFTLNDGKRVRGTAQRAPHEFIKVD